MIKTLQFTHLATNTMMLQTKSRLFLPCIRSDLDTFYNQCQDRALNRISRPQKLNEINMSSLFENFFPGNLVQKDFTQKGNEDYLIYVAKCLASCKCTDAVISLRKRLC